MMDVPMDTSLQYNKMDTIESSSSVHPINNLKVGGKVPATLVKVIRVLPAEMRELQKKLSSKIEENEKLKSTISITAEHSKLLAEDVELAHEKIDLMNERADIYKEKGREMMT